MSENETIADIVAQIRAVAHIQTADTPRSVLQFADRIEAAARRAYNKIDSSVCGIDSATSSDIDDVRKAMDKTIGDYYE